MTRSRRPVVSTQRGAPAVWDTVAAELASKGQLRCMVEDVTNRTPDGRPITERCWRIADCIDRVPMSSFGPMPATRIWVPCCERHADQVDAFATELVAKVGQV